MGRVTVRRARPTDLATVVRLRRALLRHHRDDPLFGRTHPDLARRLRASTKARLAAPATEGAVFLALEDGVPVGTLAVEAQRANPLLWPERFAYIGGAFVIPAARGRGITRRLVARAERWAREQGLTDVRLDHWSDNPLAAATWTRLGYAPVEVLRLKRLDPPAPPGR